MMTESKQYFVQESNGQFDTTISTGLYISIDPSFEIMRKIFETDTETRVEVFVKLFDEAKEFTFEDFFTRLGFAWPPTKK